MIITPIIMESAVEQVEHKLRILLDRREERVHFDIGDGLYSDYLSVAPADLQGMPLDKIKMDFHLLVDDPAEYISEIVALPPSRIFGQIERMGSQVAFVKEILNYQTGSKPGLALAIETEVEELEEEALQYADGVILLAVPAGTSGSSLDRRVYDKVRLLRKRYQGTIIVDGGVNKDLADEILASGATELAANSAYWRGDFN